MNIQITETISFSMGSSKSHEFSSLVCPRRPEEWRVVEERESYQVWERRSDSKLLLAYPVNQVEIDSEQKLQLYNFRKLNHGNLVAVECILTDEDSLCSVPRHSYILVEHIPLLLAHLARPLTLPEALTLLSAVFAGYNTLNYVYGPLFTSAHMIGFTPQGVPKVWVSPNFASNEPCPVAVNAGEEFLASSIEERAYCCVQKILDIVEGAVGGGYPVDLRIEAARVTSFAEGQEFVEHYCRKRGIYLQERVSVGKMGVQPLHFQTETHMLSQRFSLINYAPSNSVYARVVGGKPDSSANYLQTLSSTQHQTLQLHSQTANSQISLNSRPFPRSSLNNSTKINFVFNGSTANSLPIPIPALSLPEKQNIPLVESPSIPERETELSPIIEQSQHKPYRMGERPHIDSVESKEEILFHPPLNQQESQEDSEQCYQLMVHEVRENDEIDEDPREAIDNLETFKEIAVNREDELQRVITTESVDEQGLTQSDFELQPYDELKKWEESLLKLSEKQKRSQEVQQERQRSKKAPDSQEEQYLSQERDKVNIEPDRPIHSFATETELQAYIRNKYKEYLTSEEQGDPQPETRIDSQRYFKQNYQAYDPEPEEPVYEPRAAYRPPKLQFAEQGVPQRFQGYDQSDQRKYTFGKIELDPISAKQQYTKAQQRQRVSVPLRARKSQDRSIEDRYNKYVKNRQPRTSLLHSKDISSILPPFPTENSTTRKEYLLQQYLQQSLPLPKQPPSTSLTYDRLRELLWA